MYRICDLQKNNDVIRECRDVTTKIGDTTNNWVVIRTHGFSTERLATEQLPKEFIKKSLSVP
jgi:hypothetical protein